MTGCFKERLAGGCKLKNEIPRSKCFAKRVVSHSSSSFLLRKREKKPLLAFSSLLASTGMSEAGGVGSGVVLLGAAVCVASLAGAGGDVSACLVAGADAGLAAASPVGGVSAEVGGDSGIVGAVSAGGGVDVGASFFRLPKRRLNRPLRLASGESGGISGSGSSNGMALGTELRSIGNSDGAEGAGLGVSETDG